MGGAESASFFNLTVYRYLKTFRIMAIETRFKCNRSDNDYLKVYSNLGSNDIIITLEINGIETEIYLDIPTSIKLSKTIRTNINQIKGI